VGAHEGQNGERAAPANGAVGPFDPLLRLLLPRQVTTTASLGRAMIEVAANGYSKPNLSSDDINQVAAAAPVHM
jgi:hypothetical protein